MSNRPGSCLPSLLLLSTVFLFPFWAPAQEPATKPSEQVQVLIQTLEARSEKFTILQKKIDSSQGERRAIYRNELLRGWKDFEDNLDELIENLPSETESGIKNAEQREKAKSLSLTLAAGLSKVIQTLDSSLQKLEEELVVATGEERSALNREAQRESANYGNFLKLIVHNIEQMKTLGLNTSMEEELIDQLLEERAQILEGRLRLALTEHQELLQVLRRAVKDDKPEAQKELNNANERVTFSAENLRFVLDQMDIRGVQTKDRREIVLKATGDLDAGDLDADVALSLLQSWADDFKTWFEGNGARVLIRFGMAFLILGAFWILSRMAAKFVGLWVTSSHLDLSALLQEFFIMLASRSLQAVGILVVFSHLGIELGPLLAGLGIAGFVIGFALQETLSNFAAGLMILIYRPYDTSDSVEIDNVAGVVTDMSLVSTTIKTFDNQKLIVPNSKIWGNVIRNLTAEPERRVDLIFGISYQDDIAKAERLLFEEVQKHEMVLKEPAPLIKVSALADSSVNLIVRPWVKTENYWNVYWDLTRSVKLRFDKEGITIPFPQRDVHFIKSGDS